MVELLQYPNQMPEATLPISRKIMCKSILELMLFSHKSSFAARTESTFYRCPAKTTLEIERVRLVHVFVFNMSEAKATYLIGIGAMQNY